MKRYISSALRHRDPFVCIVVLLAGSLLAAAQHESVIYSFGAKAGDGADPLGGLIADTLGNFYGTTYLGGANNAGTVYELNPPVGHGPWTETVLYSFTGSVDGANPSGDLVFDVAGNLYGTTENGGDASCSFGGCGTIFELSPPSVPGGNWTETTLYNFIGGADGIHPNGGLAFDEAGNLYGTTGQGGSDEGVCGPPELGCGTVFELSPSEAPSGMWTEEILYRFADNGDGAFPLAPVIFDKAGNIYGTASQGGYAGCMQLCGTLFELTPSDGGVWTELTIHDFGATNDGATPSSASLLMTASRAIVGTTAEGGRNGSGTVFGALPPSIPGGQWLYAVLYNFRSNEDGVEPLAGVISNNDVLYGTTFSGGLNSVIGTIFQLTRAGFSKFKETGLYTFKGGPGDGALPAAPVLMRNNALFGTTRQGGSANGGTVFRIVH